MGNLETDKKQETIERLKSSAKEAFLKQGYAKASLRAICKNAGVTTGAFYFSYESKEALLRDILEPLIQQYQCMIQELMKREEEHSEEGTDLDKILMEFLLKHHEETVIIMEKAQGSCYEDFHIQIEQMMVQNFNRFYRVKLGWQPDQNLIHILARQRIEGCMAIIRENYDMEYSLYLTEKMGVHANGGTEKLIESLLKEAHQL